MKKIKYLMPCISLPLIITPVMSLTGCNCNGNGKEQEFDGKVTEAEFKAGIDTLWNTNNRGKFQVETTIDVVKNAAINTTMVVDGDNILIKYNDKIVGGEYFDSQANCKWEVGVNDPTSSDTNMYASSAGNKNSSYVHMAGGFDDLYAHRNNFSNFTFTNKSYSISEKDGSGLITYTTTAVFNKNKKIENISWKMEYVDEESQKVIKSEIIQNITYNNISITQEQIAKLKPVNVFYPKSVSNETITFNQHSIYPSVEESENDVSNFYILGPIQYSNTWKANAVFDTDSTLTFASGCSEILVDYVFEEETSSEERYNSIVSAIDGSKKLTFELNESTKIPEDSVNSILSVRVKADSSAAINIKSLTFTIGSLNK